MEKRTSCTLLLRSKLCSSYGSLTHPKTPSAEYIRLPVKTFGRVLFVITYVCIHTVPQTGAVGGRCRQPAIVCCTAVNTDTPAIGRLATVSSLVDWQQTRP